ncbi:putative phage baseplate assembly protein [Catenulispora sp. GAS73]|uniref:putative baseplate assembly protein n=1 Tax=Catenulispora sp. GAS73 TaxID=3156269 RepID=UPI0035193E73
MTSSSGCPTNCGCAGCRTGTALETPAAVFNPPGQNALTFRVGTHGQFLSSLRARLSSPAYPALSKLTVRSTDDPAIALLDAWAVLGDLLSFYSERIADEGYLRTATQDASIQMLGGLVGYRPRPGVAGGTALAFTIDPPQNPGGDTVALLPAGTRAQSVPTPGNDSQYFEIGDDLTARSSLNQLSVLTRLPYQLTAAEAQARAQIYLAGTANNVKAGDQLLFVFSSDKAAQGQRILLQVPGVTIDQANAITVVGLPGPAQPNLKDLTYDLQNCLGLVSEPTSPAPVPKVPELSALAARFDTEVLQAKLNPAGGFTSPAALAAACEQARQLAVETLVLAQRYQTVAYWLRAWIVELASLRDRGLALEPPQPANSGTGQGTGDPALAGLAGIFSALHTTPNPPPPSARDLPLDPVSLYAIGSDLGPQLLAALDPQVSSGLYQAWQHTAVSAPSALQELQAMRVVATPFGATAPLVANLDPHTGQVNGYTDWPLAGTKEISLLLNYDVDTGTVQKQAGFTYLEGGPNTATLDLPTATTTRQVGPMSVTVTSYPTPGQTPPQAPHAPTAPTAPTSAPAIAAASTPAAAPESGAWHLHLPGHHEAAAAQPGPQPSPQPAPQTAAPAPDAAPAPTHEPGLLVAYQDQFDGWTVFIGLPVDADGTTVDVDGKVHVLVTSGQSSGTKEFHLAQGDKPDTSLLDGISVAVSRAASGSSAPTVSVALTTPSSTPSKNRIWLDSTYDGIAVGSWVVIDRPSKQTAAALAAGRVSAGGPAGQVSRAVAAMAAAAMRPDPAGASLARVITRVTAVRVQARADFGIAGKVTQLDLDDDWLDDTDVNLAQIRDTTVYARGETLALATEPVPDDVQGAEIELAQLYTGITPGRLIAVSGERTDIPNTPGVTGAELAMVAGVNQSVDPSRPGDTVRTTLTLASALAYTYKRATVQIHGNVAAATQGASRDDPIGSGDAGTPNQTFKLWQAPLTWLPAGTTPSGAASTLQVRVNGVLWTEVDSFAGHGPAERIYTTSTASDGKTVVTFGDGVTGARLPTGTENVRARYRVGLGRSGDVAAGQVTQLTTRPLGVSAVTNPVAGTGGADPDPPELARSNIPLALTALDRLVSVPDYEDFARSYAGIGRASAQRLSDGSRQVVHVTVAGVDDSPLLPDNGLLASLHAALSEFGDPQLPVAVAVRELVLLIVALSVKLTPDAAWDLVEPVLRSTLTNLLSVSNRQLGQPAYASEVIAAAQAVPGVDHVDLQAFTGVPGSTTPLGLTSLFTNLADPSTSVPSALAAFDEARHTVVTDPATGAAETLSHIAAEYAISVEALLALNPGLRDVVLSIGDSIVVFRGIRPAQLVVLSDSVPDTLILREITS